MLRKRTDGRLERLRPDGTWQEVPEHEQPEAVRRAQVVDWSQLSDLFDDEGGTDAGPVRITPAVAAGAGAAGDVAAAGEPAGAGRSTVVETAAPDLPARGGSAAPRGAGDGFAEGQQADGVAGAEAANVDLGGGGGAAGEVEALDLDVPGLTVARGSSVLERLRRRRGLSTGALRPKREKVEVSERAARPRGPAVKDGTAERIARRERKSAGPSRQVTSKPAPGSLVESPRWMQELFETHFRSSRSMELRKTMNRMKLSRQDYAIGWMVAIEAARKDPSILHVKELV